MDLWTPEGLQAAYEWLTAEGSHDEEGTDFEPLTDAELEAVLKKIKGRKPSPLPPGIERPGSTDHLFH